MKQNGFTIIELMIVFVIVNIFGLMFIGAINNQEEKIKLTKIIKSTPKKIEVLDTYKEFKKKYNILMIAKYDNTASIGKDSIGRIWKFKHKTPKDWTIINQTLIGYTVDYKKEQSITSTYDDFEYNY